MAEWVPEKKKEQPSQPLQISPSSIAIRGFLDRQDIKGFIDTYFENLKMHNVELVSILAPVFKSDSKDLFEFLRDVFNNNTKNQEWNVANFFVTIMNIGIAIGKEGPPIVYDLLLLTDNASPSPIYTVATILSKSPQNPELNELFMNKWNQLFKKVEKIEKTETFVPSQSNVVLPMMPSFMSRFSRETQFMIISLVVLLVIMGIGLSGYFFTKYNKQAASAEFGTSIGTNIEIPSVQPKFEF